LNKLNAADLTIHVSQPKAGGQHLAVVDFRFGKVKSIAKRPAILNLEEPYRQQENVLTVFCGNCS
jgi:hypothetical protein